MRRRPCLESAQAGHGDDRGKSPTPSQKTVSVAGDDLHVLLCKGMDWLGKENPLEGTIFGAQRCKREDWEKHEGFLPLAHY